VASLDFANVMLNESSLSFLGIGVQPPDVTWGLMVASGRNFLTTAWCERLRPGFADPAPRHRDGNDRQDDAFAAAGRPARAPATARSG
jgi:hypothetical protein